MSTAKSPHQNPSDPDQPVHGLRVTSYEQVSGMVLALLMLLGGAAVGMFFIWLSSQVWISPKEAIVDLFEPEPGGGGSGAPNVNLEEPKQEEIEVIEPQLDKILEAVTDAVSTTVATLDALQPKQFTGRGQGEGTGDGRGKGPGGDGDADIIPPWDRWEFRYQSNSIESYSRQLDFFQIELGAVGGGLGQNIDYANAFSSGSPKRHSAPAADEKRIRFTWTKGVLMQNDIALLNQAGIVTKNRIVFQLITPELEKTLKLLEREYAGKRDVRAIGKTIFEVRSKAGGYEFFVKDQRYRSYVQ